MTLSRIIVNKKKSLSDYASITAVQYCLTEERFERIKIVTIALSGRFGYVY